MVSDLPVAREVPKVVPVGIKARRLPGARHWAGGQKREGMNGCFLFTEGGVPLWGGAEERVS